ncbi:hypothetical protein SS50377_24208 [Spironucleus salmonicida]|uniref:Uncharacterized protein n=1 Tax=Spironucleus salmonicida TaxID=348837 RepID=V6M3J9_9EUKA|nr:hypothetical protein SS50377_24208 [Spironucleus salmonicida]|eukprot:EST47869.1 Hypothetical protein SS50377_12060 [Spironucleus salmonicida]
MLLSAAEINDLTNQPALVHRQNTALYTQILAELDDSSAISLRAAAQICSFLEETPQVLSTLLGLLKAIEKHENYESAYEEIPVSTDLAKYAQNQHAICSYIITSKLLIQAAKPQSSQLFHIARELKRLKAFKESQFVEQLGVLDMTAKGGIYSQGRQKTTYCKSQRARKRQVEPATPQISPEVAVTIPAYLNTAEFQELTLKQIGPESLLDGAKIDGFRRNFIKKTPFQLESVVNKYKKPPQYVEISDFEPVSYPRIQGRFQRFSEEFIPRESGRDFELEALFGLSSKEILALQKTYHDKEKRGRFGTEAII